MDTTAENTQPYTREDSRDGVILSILLGIILGFCATAFSMLTSIPLDTYLMVGGAIVVGVSGLELGVDGHRMSIRAFNELFGLVTTVVMIVSTYELLQLI